MSGEISGVSKAGGGENIFPDYENNDISLVASVYAADTPPFAPKIAGGKIKGLPDKAYAGIFFADIPKESQYVIQYIEGIYNQAASDIGKSEGAVKTIGNALYYSFIDTAYHSERVYKKELDALENQTGIRHSIYSGYQTWSDGYYFLPFPDNFANMAYKQGSIPMITWEPMRFARDHSKPLLDEMLEQLRSKDGDLYDYVVAWAKGAKAFGKPFFLRLMHEMNGTTYPWSLIFNGEDLAPAKFIEVWQLIHDIFDEVGATNVTWVWCPDLSPEVIGQVQKPWNEISKSYPGDRNVDWIAFDMFNNGRGQGFEHVRPYYEEMRKAHPEKDFMFAELGTVEMGQHPDTGENLKAIWLRRFYADAVAAGFRALIAFSVKKERDYDVTSSLPAMEAYRDALSNNPYLAQMAPLASRTIPKEKARLAKEIGVLKLILKRPAKRVNERVAHIRNNIKLAKLKSDLNPLTSDKKQANALKNESDILKIVAKQEYEDLVSICPFYSDQIDLLEEIANIFWAEEKNKRLLEKREDVLKEIKTITQSHYYGFFPDNIVKSENYFDFAIREKRQDAKFIIARGQLLAKVAQAKRTLTDMNYQIITKNLGEVEFITTIRKDSMKTIGNSFDAAIATYAKVDIYNALHLNAQDIISKILYELVYEMKDWSKLQPVLDNIFKLATDKKYISKMNFKKKDMAGYLSAASVVQGDIAIDCASPDLQKAEKSYKAALEYLKIKPNKDLQLRAELGLVDVKLGRAIKEKSSLLAQETMQEYKKFLERTDLDPRLRNRTLQNIEKALSLSCNIQAIPLIQELKILNPDKIKSYDQEIKEIMGRCY